MMEVSDAIDVHKKTAVVCPRQSERDGTVKSEVKTFGTTTPELLQMMDWLSEWEVTTVAIESTAEYWKPVPAPNRPEIQPGHRLHQ